MYQLTKCTKKQLQILQDEVNMFRGAKLASVAVDSEKVCTVQIDKSEDERIKFKVTHDGKIFFKETVEV